jgi:hypothetical protein
MNVTEKAMLVKLSISQWTARRFDLKATNHVIKDYGAKNDAGRFNKLLVDLDAVKTYQKAANEARTFHYENTLPWGDDDSRILPAKNYIPYTKKMRKLKESFEKAVNDFVSEYPGLIDRAQRNLNGLFNVKDYPSSADLPGKFDFSVNVIPIPAAGDFRVSLSDDEVEQIKADIEARVQDSISTAMKDAWDRLFRVVKHMAEKLRDQKAIFRDSLVGNIQELCDILPRLNLTDDPNLKKVVRETKQALAGLDPEVLRKHEIDRKMAADQADGILKKMSSYMGE